MRVSRAYGKFYTEKIVARGVDREFLETRNSPALCWSPVINITYFVSVLFVRKATHGNICLRAGDVLRGLLRSIYIYVGLISYRRGKYYSL